METTREYRLFVDEVELHDCPSFLGREILLRRRVQQLQQRADDDERRPAWEVFAAARQGSE